MSTNTLTMALILVKMERDRQDKKWGPIEVLVERSPERWLALIGEEYGECCRACVEDDPPKLLEELTELAATTVSAIEALTLRLAERA